MNLPNTTKINYNDLQNIATKRSQFQVFSVFVDMTGSTYNLVVNII